MSSIIRIVRTPIGEAPLWVREKWIGLELPLARAAPVTARVSGVLSGARIRTWMDIVIALLRGKTQRLTGYVVDVDVAVAILSQASPEAATWWRQNTPYLFGGVFIFDATACQPIDVSD